MKQLITNDTNMSDDLTDTWKVVKFTHAHGYVLIKSRRSGEAEELPQRTYRSPGLPVKQVCSGKKGATKLIELIRVSEEPGSSAKMLCLRIQVEGTEENET